MAAAALAVSGFAFVANGYAAEPASEKIDRAVDKTGDAIRNAADKTRDAIGNIDVKTENAAKAGSPNLPPGIQAITKDDSKDIHDMLGAVTETAFTKDGYGNLVKRFVDADRNRLSSFGKDKTKFATLDGRIDQIRKDWKAKYNQDFDVPHKIAFGPDFKGFTIVQGEIANPALLSNWPVDNKAKASLKVGDNNVGAELKTSGAGTSATATGARDETNKPGNKPGDRNLEKGRNVAIVTFPEMQGAPEITASLIHELPDQWRFDIPDNIDSMKFYQNLLAHMTAFGDMKDQWPADVNEAYRLATHHVLEAHYDLPVKK